MNVLTRGDMDGLTATVLLSEVQTIKDVRFAHPKDVQDGKVEAGPDDIVVNLPYIPGCALWFDHHPAEKLPEKYKGKYGLAPSAARLVYEYLNNPKLDKYKELLAETDRVDSAMLVPEDVTAPKGYVLLSYTIDPRTGLGPFKDFFMMLVNHVKTKTIDEILKTPEVKFRVDRVLMEQDEFQKALAAHSRLDGNVIITDFRGLGKIPAGNRFLIYTMFPKGNISIRIFDGKGREFTVAAIGHSIFNRTSKTHVGELCTKYGGGGHKGAGTAQFANDTAEAKINELLTRMKSDG
jgi:hypothetical protein